MKIWLGGVILAIAIVLGLVPLALGHLAMAGHRALLAELIEGQPGREILRQSEQRGWLASTARRCGSVWTAGSSRLPGSGSDRP